MIKVLIAEDHDFTRQSIVFGLNKIPEINVTGEAINGQEALDMAMKNPPDIILMDVGMPILSGINATKEIKKFNKDIKVLIFTSHKEQNIVLEAFKSGADAYCMKNISIENLMKVIDTVKDGSIWIDPEIAGYVLQVLQMQDVNKQIEESEAKRAKPDYNLTTREKEILKLMADGLSNKHIAQKLVVSLYTVKNHVSNIIKKLAVEDRTQAAVVALKNGLFL